MERSTGSSKVYKNSFLGRFVIMLRSIWVHSCLGINKGILLMGGKWTRDDSAYYDSKEVYLLRHLKWTVVGKLNEQV